MCAIYVDDKNKSVVAINHARVGIVSICGGFYSQIARLAINFAAVLVNDVSLVRSKGCEARNYPIVEVIEYIK